MDESTFKSVTIIGVGLIGGSVASALHRQCPEVVVRGIDSETSMLETRLADGIISEGALPTDPIVDQWLSGTTSDLVILATPVFSARFWFERLAALDYPGVVTDVVSTKNVITGMAAELLPHPSLYIPGHPMAGSEMSGIQAASPTLFQGAYWILCPDANTDPVAYQRLHLFVVSLGARVLSLDRETHDSAIAIVSHVPHMVASSLVELAGNHAESQPNLLRLAAGGFKDSTRIAAGSAQLWTGIAMDNQEAIANGLREFGDIIGNFEEAVRTGDSQRLQQMLDASAELRRSLPAKWVPDSSRLVECRIPMYNRSGVIAQVTTIASKAGCNIQSIDIDHMSDQNAVLDLIFTDEGDIGKLSAAFLKAGYDFSFSPLNPED